MFFESVDVVTGAAETVFIGDFADGVCCLGQIVQALLNAVFGKILKNGFSHVAFEKTAAFSGAKVDDRCDLLQSDFFGIVVMQERQQIF